MPLNETAKIKATPILNEVEKPKRGKMEKNRQATQCDMLILLGHGKDTKICDVGIIRSYYHYYYYYYYTITNTNILLILLLLILLLLLLLLLILLLLLLLRLYYSYSLLLLLLAQLHTRGSVHIRDIDKTHSCHAKKECLGLEKIPSKNIAAERALSLLFFVCFPKNLSKKPL